ncbi:MAG: hypothetical protein II886_13115 [Prevotella sp.]|nr:hypothetical protein [Prevotella sp.]
MSSGREIRRPVSEEDIRRWEQAWTEMMVTIWRENILRLGIVDTMTLHNKMSHRITDTGGQIQIAHEFMLYGIYVARGVGNGYRRGNPGDLDILNKDYRKAHGLNKPRRTGLKYSDGSDKYTSGKPREKRDWFTGRYLSSIDVLNRVEVQLYGEAYMGTLSNVVDAMFGSVRVSGSMGTVVTPALSRF